MANKKNLPVGRIHTSIADQKERFTGWTGGYGVHKDKSKFDRKKNRRELRKSISEE